MWIQTSSRSVRSAAAPSPARGPIRVLVVRNGGLPSSVRAPEGAPVTALRQTFALQTNCTLFRWSALTRSQSIAAHLPC